jgi:hypothetical protein
MRNTNRTIASEKFTYFSEPTASRVSGNFPGSALNLRYFFGHDHDNKSSVEIIL